MAIEDPDTSKWLPAWKTVRTRNSPATGLYRYPGQIVEAGDVEGDPRKATSWIWVCTNLETVAWRFHHLHGCDFSVADVIELRYDPEGAISVESGSSCEPVPVFRARRGYMKVKRCQLVGKVTDVPECSCTFGAHLSTTVQAEQARQALHERVAHLRADAIRAGLRARPHQATTDTHDRRVLDLLRKRR